MLKYAFTKTNVILYLLVTSHAITRIRAASAQESYISLESYVRGNDVIKYKLPPAVVSNNTISLLYKAWQIIDVDELNQSVKVLSVLILYWWYPEIQWNTSLYNDIYTIRLDTSEVWTPSLMIPRRLTSIILELPDKVEVSNNGQVTVIMPGIQEISCYLDLLNFPYDGHNCTIQFLDVSKHNVHPQNDDSDIRQIAGHFITNAEWDLQNQDCVYVQSILNYTECWFVISRKPAFYVTTLFAPLILMSAMTLLVFCLPAKSGEKISFVISIFLSMTMYLGIINDVIPRNMNQIPRCVILILVTIMVIFLSSAATVLVVKRYNEEQEQKLCDIKNKQLHTTSKQSSNKKEIDLVYSTEKNILGFQSTGENDMSSDNACKNWVKEEAKKNKSNLRASPPTIVWRESNRISDMCDYKENIQFEKRRHNWSFAMRICSFTHRQLDRMFFWLFLCLNVVIYTSVFTLSMKK